MDCKFCAMLFPHAHNFIVYKPVKMDVGLGGRVTINITCFSTEREKITNLKHYLVLAQLH